MDGDVKNLAVLVEHVLDSVTVMHVPVKDHHPLQSEIVDSVPGGDGHVIEQTEAVWGVRLCVMTWRPDHSQGGSHLAPDNSLH